MTCYVGDQTAEAGASRPVRGPLGASFDSVNRLFAILLQKSAKTPEMAVFRRAVVLKR
jgi:hypothetical protein